MKTPRQELADFCNTVLAFGVIVVCILFCLAHQLVSFFWPRKDRR